MTTFYPNQPTPSFLKKYARNAYNRAQHDAHYNGNNNDEAAIDLQVRFNCWERSNRSYPIGKFFKERRKKSKENSRRKMRVKINISIKETATSAKNNLRVIKVANSKKIWRKAKFLQPPQLCGSLNQARVWKNWKWKNDIRKAEKY